jgi:hypothetical protein
MKKKTALERELDNIRDASIDAIGSAWSAVRAADGKLKTNERRLTSSALRGETHGTLRELVEHPIGDEILAYRIVVACSETVAGVLYKIKRALAEDAGVKPVVNRGKGPGDDPPLPPDVFAALRKKKL